LLDQVGRQRVNLQIAPLNINLKGISNDLAKPIGVELDGRINRKGTIKIAGTAVIQPLKAQLRVETERVDLASLDPFVTSQLNTRIMRLELTMKGDSLAEMRRNKIEASYRGNLALGNVRIRDKLTGEDFLKLQALHFARMDVRYGAGQPHVHIGTIALSDFYSRVILNSDGQLNLRDVGYQSRESASVGDSGAWWVAGQPAANGFALSGAHAPSCSNQRSRAGAFTDSRGYRDRSDHVQRRPSQLHRQLHQTELLGGFDRDGRQGRKLRHPQYHAR
jgi:hypothetical protein